MELVAPHLIPRFAATRFTAYRAADLEIVQVPFGLRLLRTVAAVGAPHVDLNLRIDATEKQAAVKPPLERPIAWFWVPLLRPAVAVDLDDSGVDHGVLNVRSSEQTSNNLDEALITVQLER